MNALRLLKYPVWVARKKARSLNAKIMTRVRARQHSASFDSFDCHLVRRRVSGFLDTMKCDATVSFRYKYSALADRPTLYASAYACMTLSLLGLLDELPDESKKEWLAYFDSFQNEQDGLFYDPVVDGDAFRRFDWWGARHLALHMIAAYTALGGRPKFRFAFLDEYDPGNIRGWLDRFNWNTPFSHAEDIDNKIMNIGCLLQYQRDVWEDKQAEASVEFLQQYLAERVNPETGMWGRYEYDDPSERSRMVQFAYHLFPLYFYDGIAIDAPAKVVDQVLATQNELGGFGVDVNSSACEDIDSIDILVRLAPCVPERKDDIDQALRSALEWVLCNQVDDGGFVFRLYEPLTYGHKEMASASNSGAMFPTWFRTLSLAYLAKHFALGGFQIRRAPGLEH